MLSQEQEHEFSFKSLFVPFTTLKGIHWIIFIGFVVFANMLFNGFIQDDKSYIINYPLIHQINFLSSFGPNLYNGAGQYRPLSAFIFSLLYSLFQSIPFFYHLLQLIFHILAVIMVFLIFKRFLSPVLSFFLSLIFLVHPLNVESVSYISQTNGILFFLLGIAGFLLLQQNKINTRKLLIIFVLTLISILIKESGILFLPLFVIYTILYSRKNFISLSLLTVLVAAVYIPVRLFIGHVFLSSRPLVPIASLPLEQRLMNIPSIGFYYIKTFFYPVSLAFDQQWTISQVSVQNFYAPLLLFVVVVCLSAFFTFFLYKTKNVLYKPFLFFSFWFGIGLFLYLQVFPLDATVAERWFYFPMVGLLGMVGVYLQYSGILKKYSLACIVAGVIIVSLLGIRTIIRNTNWQNPITLYTHDITVSDNYDIENGLGVQYAAEQDYANALTHILRSIAYKPYEDNLSNVASIYAIENKSKQAENYFSNALQARDYKLYFPHHHNLKLYSDYATVLLYYDKNASAVNLLLQAIKDYPDNQNLWLDLTIAYYKDHKQHEAEETALKYYNLFPSSQTLAMSTLIKQRKPISLWYIDLTGKVTTTTVE